MKRFDDTYKRAFPKRNDTLSFRVGGGDVGPLTLRKTEERDGAAVYEAAVKGIRIIRTILTYDTALIVLDTGYAENREAYLERFSSLGLSLRDIRWILLTHGHIDHVGNAAFLRAQSGARIAVGAPDRRYVNGEADLTYVREFGMTYREPFEPDRLLSDGDTLTLGDTTVTARAIPGHTEGAVCYFFNTVHGGRTYTAALHGGMGLNTMTSDYLGRKGLPLSLPRDYLNASAALKALPVDIYLGNHAGQNRTMEKLRALGQGDRDAFIDPGEWPRALDASIAEVERLTASEKAARTQTARER